MNDTNIEYDIASAFDYLFDENKPRLLRAVKLYELQVAILLGKKLHHFQERKLEYPDNWIRVSRAALNTARMVCSVRLLEHCVSEDYPDASKRMPLRKLVKDEMATKLLRRIIPFNKSRQMAYSLSWRELDRSILNRRQEQATFAPIYDVSIRYPSNDKSNAQCNWTRAASLLDFTQSDPEYNEIRRSYKSLESASTAYKFKDKKDVFVAFVWLDHFGGSYFRPVRPGAASYVNKLLAKTDNVEALRDFAGKYEFVRSRFEHHGYKPLKFRLAAPIAPREIPIPPLPEALVAMIY